MMSTGVGFGPSLCCDCYRVYSSRLSTILVDLVATGIK